MIDNVTVSVTDTIRGTESSMVTLKHIANEPGISVNTASTEAFLDLFREPEAERALQHGMLEPQVFVR